MSNKRKFNDENEPPNENRNESNQRDEKIPRQQNTEAMISAIVTNYNNNNNMNYGFRKPGEIPVQHVILLKEFQKMIKDAKPSGSESIGGEANELPVLPGLFIKNFGHVPLPVNENVAESLIQIATQAPYGLKEETLVDTKVRDTFQIEPLSIEIKSPDWNVCLKRLVDRVAQGLGCHGKVEPKLYKLLIYRKGGHFKKHRDTEKFKNMFATLVLQLPSIHEGGELVIYNEAGCKTVYDFGQSTGRAPYLSNFVAHYADVEHEVLEVKSGYRLALIYALCWINGNGGCAVNNSIAIGNLTQCLSELNIMCYKMALLLEHKYTTSALTGNGVKALKGIDNDRFNLIRNASNRLPPDYQLSFYVANASLVISAYDVIGYQGRSRSYEEENTVSSDRRNWEEHGRQKSIDEWYDIDGNLCRNEMGIGSWSIKFDFLTKIIDPNSESDEPFSNLDDEMQWGKTRHVEIEGYTGNESATKTTTYQRYLLLFWPKANEFNIFLGIGLEHGIQYLFRLLNSTFEEATYLMNLRTILKKLKECNKSLNEESSKKMMKIFEKIRNDELLQTFLSDIPIVFPVVELAKLIVIYKFNVPNILLTKLLLPVNMNNISKNCDLVKELFNLGEVDVSFEYFIHAVAPFLVNTDEFFKPKFISRYYSEIEVDFSKEKIAIFYNLADTLMLFQNKNVAEINGRLVSFVARMVTEKDQMILSSVLSMFLEKESYFCRSSFILSLFELRYNWLNDRLRTNPNFSWYMPGGIDHHPDLDSFFRSEQQQIVYSGGFNGIAHARNFAAKYSGLQDGYSISISESGIGRNAQVFIVKTKNYHKNELNKLEQYKLEFQKITKILNTYKIETLLPN